MQSYPDIKKVLSDKQLRIKLFKKLKTEIVYRLKDLFVIIILLWFASILTAIIVYRKIKLLKLTFLNYSDPASIKIFCDFMNCALTFITDFTFTFNILQKKNLVFELKMRSNYTL